MSNVPICSAGVSNPNYTSLIAEPVLGFLKLDGKPFKA